MTDMTIYALEDTSVLAFVVELFSDTPFVSVVEEYPDSDLNIPTISVEQGISDFNQYELGNRGQIRNRQYIINVFASSVAMRNEFAYRIADALKNKIPVYNYNEGFPPDVTPSLVERLDVKTQRIQPIPLDTDLLEKLYYRTMIKFIATNDRD